MNKQIKNIVIVGGGTAGWSTALNFLHKTIDTKITVVSSKEIPIIGVGESTTGRFNSLIRYVGKIDEVDFLKKTGSTYKLGIIHEDWHTIGESFSSPLGDEFENETSYPSIDYDYYRYYHVSNKLPYIAMQSKYMMENKLPFLNIEENNPYKDEPFYGNHGKLRWSIRHTAYHLDTYKVGQYLKEEVLKNNRVTYIDAIVEDVKINENGFLDSITTKNGQEVKGDLFVDCSGFKRILVDKLEKNNFVSYENQLSVNSALTFHIENKPDTIINNYTKVTAKKYGWLWDIPLQHRKGMGYVFNNNYITPEQAQEEIEKDLGFKIEPQSYIKFNAGRMEKIWTKNVISTGLASGFIEPLEATSIHMTVLQINHFIESYFTHNLSFNKTHIENYNKDITTIWNDIKDFIILHYQTPRNDTDFWIEASSKERRGDRLNNLLELWKTRMPRTSDYKGGLNNSFYHLGNTLWLQILHGMKLLDSDIAKTELNDFNLYNHADRMYDLRNKFDEYILEKSTMNNDYYKNIDSFREYSENWLSYDK